MPGLSETIRVRSVVGRFLEHSRVFAFEAGDTETYLLGSADLMPRNLDHRIEVVAPVEDARAREEVSTRAGLAAGRQHARLAAVGRRQLAPAGSRIRASPGRGTHQVLMRRARLRARRRSRAVRPSTGS